MSAPGHDFTRFGLSSPRVRTEDGFRTVAAGTTAGDVLPPRAAGALPWVAALADGEVVTLRRPLVSSCEVSGLTVADGDGWLVFRRTMAFLLAKAAFDALPDRRLRVHFSMRRGVYATIRDAGEGAPARPATEEEREALQKALSETIARDEPIFEIPCSYGDALTAFAAEGRHDQVGLLRHVNTPIVRVQACGGFRVLHEGPMLASTGALTPVELRAVGAGMLLIGPSREDPGRVAALEDILDPALLAAHEDHARWGDVLGVRCVGDLNAAIADRRADEIVDTCEGLHERNFADLAARIAARGSRLVLLAGPSSAGKTTSCKRLSVHLRVLGLRPVQLSTDDYFRPTEEDPLGPDGKPDFEHIDSVDTEALQADFKALFEGKSIRRRVFHFQTQKPIFLNETISLGPRDVLCVEGIHALNPVLTADIPSAWKFHIYLSALTQLSLDGCSILSTTDNRLIRRLVRDNAFRGHSAQQTLALWDSVRRGEERWIFPFQKRADATFNTSLDYELSVLRPYAEALLSGIKPGEPGYATARRLQGVLRNFTPIPPTHIPRNSILRETIGGSSFDY